MTTFFKSSKHGTAVIALSAFRAARSSTDELTNDLTGAVEAQPLSLTELTRRLVSRSGDEAALSAVCVALRDGGDVEELVALLESWSNAADGLPDDAMAELAFRIAQGCTGAHARELCRTALDLCPVHADALSMFENLADASWTDELCARYQVFLEHAPSHGVSPDLYETVTNKLVAAERLEHNDKPQREGVDAVQHEDLWDLLKRALARTVPEVDSVADRLFLDGMSMQA